MLQSAKSSAARVKKELFSPSTPLHNSRGAWLRGCLNCWAWGYSRRQDIGHAVVYCQPVWKIHFFVCFRSGNCVSSSGKAALPSHSWRANKEHWERSCSLGTALQGQASIPISLCWQRAKNIVHDDFAKVVWDILNVWEHFGWEEQKIMKKAIV